MKKVITAFLSLAFILTFSCSKTEVSKIAPTEPEAGYVTDEDHPIDHPCCPDEPGGGEPFSGFSNCNGASYSVSHGNELSYNISFSISGGAMQGLNFTHSFNNPTPTLVTYTLQSKTATYNPGNGVVTIQVYYTKKTKVFGTEYETTEYIVIFDYINLCEGEFIHNGF
jgi:hypothetical protein